MVNFPLQTVEGVTPISLPDFPDLEELADDCLAIYKAPGPIYECDLTQDLLSNASGPIGPTGPVGPCPEITLSASANFVSIDPEETEASVSVSLDPDSEECHQQFRFTFNLPTAHVTYTVAYTIEQVDDSDPNLIKARARILFRSPISVNRLPGESPDGMIDVYDVIGGVFVEDPLSLIGRYGFAIYMQPVSGDNALLSPRWVATGISCVLNGSA